MSQSMVGDGCRYCQPQEHIDRLGEWLEEAQAESDKLTVIVAECRDAGGFGDPCGDGVEGWAALGDPAEVPNFIEKAFTKLTQERDALVEACSHNDLIIRNLAMQVRVLCSRLKKHEPDNTAISDCMEYQSKHNLTSALRMSEALANIDKGESK
jgi:hypothetical protein